MLIGVFKFFCWFFFIYYLIKILSRFLAPYLIKYFANKMQERFSQQFNQKYSKNTTQKEGSVIIEKTNNSTKIKSEEIGEYVDFEEVD